jgi:hypothetical protein
MVAFWKKGRTIMPQGRESLRGHDGSVACALGLGFRLRELGASE